MDFHGRLQCSKIPTKFEAVAAASSMDLTRPVGVPPPLQKGWRRRGSRIDHSHSYYVAEPMHHSFSEPYRHGVASFRRAFKNPGSYGRTCTAHEMMMNAHAQAGREAQAERLSILTMNLASSVRGASRASEALDQSLSYNRFLLRKLGYDHDGLQGAARRREALIAKAEGRNGPAVCIRRVSSGQAAAESASEYLREIPPLRHPAAGKILSGRGDSNQNRNIQSFESSTANIPQFTTEHVHIAAHEVGVETMEQERARKRLDSLISSIKVGK